MSKLKAIQALVLTVAIVLSGVPASAAEPMIIDFRNPSLAPAAGMVGYGIAETRTGSNWLARFPPVSGTNAGCEDIGLGNCKDVVADILAGKNDYKLEADADLSVCRDADETFCIESLTLTGADQMPVSGQLIREPIAGGFSGTPAIGLPRATAPSLWNVSGVPNAAGHETYVVRAHAEMYLAAKTKKFSVGSFSIEVFPVKMTNYSDTREGLTKMGMSPLPERIGGGFATASAPADCAFSEPGVCAKIQDYAPNTRVGVSVRVPTYLSGWFDGRVDEVAVKSGRLDAQTKRISISGFPMDVPSFAVKLPEGSTEALLLGLQKGSYLTTVTNTGNGIVPWLNPRSSIPVLAKIAGNKGVGSRSIWRVSTSFAGARVNTCSSIADVLGVVTSNAMAYAPGAPSFQGDTFSYEVAGMRLASNGSVQEGFYNLLVDSRIARCLANLPSGALKATIEIVDSDGTQSVTTSTFVEKDGWLNVRVAGFHFSSPTVKVKFSSAQKTTITCVSTKNKKLTKKVTAVTPKCPAGFKKK